MGQDELRALSDSIRTWEALHRWLDSNPWPAAAPVIRRLPLRPGPIQGSLRAALRHRLRHGRSRNEVRQGWQRVVRARQRAALALTLLTTGAILYLSWVVLTGQHMDAAIIALYLPIYGLMTLLLTSSFFKTMLGTWHATRGPEGNPWHPAHGACDPREGIRTAILFPVLHEDIARVAAGMAATWSSLRQQGAVATGFDFFLLSDSRALASRIAEEAAVHHLRTAFPDGRFFYRWRRLNRNAKSGNIADFCRRWGNGYEYMLVMDADSVMDGKAITSLLRMMEGNDRIGILQTNPIPVMRKSLFGRMQQFAARLYGATFCYSLQSMYMGHGSYIGHNAMVRVRPFAEHCVLPYLSGPVPWGGKPLSHDIVESALMARAGYEVWFLPDVKGSYEEIPSNGVTYLMRERRWMQGNLQHLRLLFLSGLRAIHRETFLTGSMGYIAAPLWAVFLLLSGYGVLRFLGLGLKAAGSIQLLVVPVLMLFLSSLVFLFLPRALSLAMHFRSPVAAGFGGKDKLAWSLMLETAFSLLFSPIQMIMVSRFVWMWARRKAVIWGPQARDDTPLNWETCFRTFGWISLAGIAALLLIMAQLRALPGIAGAAVQAFSHGRLRPGDFVVWMSPVLIGFALSPLIVKGTSHPLRLAETRRLFVTPEEIDPPAVLKDVTYWEDFFRPRLPGHHSLPAALEYAVTEVQFYVCHRTATRYRPALARLLVPRIEKGDALSEKEMSLALEERRCFDALHAGAHGFAGSDHADPPV